MGICVQFFLGGGSLSRCDPVGFFPLFLPSDIISSSKRLMPVFWVRVCRLEVSGLDGAVPADALSPIRSTSAEPGCGGGMLFSIS